MAALGWLLNLGFGGSGVEFVFTPAAPCRTLYVGVESRTLVVPFENRTLEVRC